MRAIVISSPGGPDVLAWTEVPDLAPATGEVLIDVVAAGVNRADLLQRQGNYAAPPGASEVPGLECAGRIAALGEGVSGFQIGDEVCALLAGGGYAEQVVVPAGQVLPVPAEVSLVEAAALPEAVCTVWSNVFMIARLAPHENFFVHGGSGGVGTMAIQLAKRFGGWVGCTAGSEDKLDRCRKLGADAAVNYRTEDFVARIQAETDGHGVDVLLDNMGAKYLSRNVQALAPGGRLVVIGLQGGLRGELDLGQLLSKQGSIAATGLRARPSTAKADIVSAVQASVWPVIESGEVQPVIDRTIPLSDAAEAHRVMESSAHIGKILLIRE